MEKPSDWSLFETYDDVKTLVEALFLSHNISAEAQDATLLFIDEIQELPKAIQALRYFFEEVPYLHVIAAGSLLEFALKDVKGFPVGRIEYLYLYPLNFAEYLEAIEHDAALEQLNTISFKPLAQGTLMELCHRYPSSGVCPKSLERTSKTVIWRH